jgi:hypothetical protein
MPWAVTSPFNAPRDYSSLGGKVNDKHEGVDVAPTTGATARVLAVADGTVTKVATSAGYGKYVIVSSTHNGTPYQTWRAHMDFVSIAVGQQVKKGDVLGICGATGNATGRHDHLTMTSPVGMSGYIVAGVVNPTPYYPQPAAGIDLLPYLKGDGRIYQMTVLWKGQQHSQQMQTQVDGAKFYQVKNSEWEELWPDTSYIYRGADTSPGNGMYYTQRTLVGNQTPLYGAKWIPRYWTPGMTYERNPLVTFYYKDTGAQVNLPDYAPGQRVTYLKFVAKHATWKQAQGVTFNDVIELHWLLKPDSQNAERYFYARGFGLVGWSSWSGDYSFVAEVFDPGERQPMTREKIAPPK